MPVDQQRRTALTGGPQSTHLVEAVGRALRRNKRPKRQKRSPLGRDGVRVSVEVGSGSGRGDGEAVW